MYPDPNSDNFNDVLSKQEFGVGSKRNYIWQEPIQLMLRNYISTYTPYESILLYHQLGSGKCMAKDTEILMYDGTIKKIQDVQPGDLLMGDDSTPRTVRSLARGQDHMYQITPKDKGRKYTVNKEHILCLQAPGLPRLTHNRHPKVHNFRITWIQDNAFQSKCFSYKKKTKGQVQKQADAFFQKIQSRHQTVIEISVLDFLKLPPHHQAALQGYKVPVEFKTKPLDVDPYLFGFALNIQSQNHIPHQFKCNSRKNRLALLAGLLEHPTQTADTALTLPSKNETLIKDIIFICESLGFCVEKAIDTESGTTQLSLAGDLYEIPTKISRSQKTPRSRQHCHSLLYKFHVTYIGQDDYYGFVLDDNCRYLLTDFTVTHNTCTSITIAEGFKEYVKNMGKRIVVLVKNKNIERNFYNELVSKCTRDEYLDDDQKELYFSSSKDEDVANFQRNVHRNLHKTYEFLTYGTFVNKVLGAKVYQKGTTKLMYNQDNTIKRKISGDPITNFNNTVVIVDEAHNTTNNEVYTALHKVLSNSYNYRLILLTATPVFDNVKEIFELSNLLNANNLQFQFPIRNDLVRSDKEYIIREPFPSNVLRGSVFRLSDFGLKQLAQALNGKVSFLQSNKDTYPTKIEMGQPMIRGRTDSAKLVFCGMSDLQYNSYTKALAIDSHEFAQNDVATTSNLEADENIRETSTVSQSNSLYKNSTDASTIVYPDGSYGREGFKKYQSQFGSILNKDAGLRQLSAKLFMLLTIIESSPGTVFVYSNYVSEGGTAIVREMLLANGFGEFEKSTSQPKRNFVVFTEESREKYRRIFNSRQNKDGSIIKILIGSPLISEGITLKNVRQIHILEPCWNMSRINQIVGRAVRNHSHDDLPPQDRTVAIYKYASVKEKTEEKDEPTKGFYIDWQKYILSENKDRANKKVERLLKEVSFDCEYLRERNMARQTNADHTADCDYTQCNYTCALQKPNRPLDKSTYQLYIDFFDKFDIEFAMSIIRDLFRTYFIWDIQEITAAVQKQEPMITNEAIYSALGHMIENKSAVTDMYGRDGFIYNKGDLYIFNDYNIDIHASFWSKILDFNTQLNKYTLPEFTQTAFGKNPWYNSLKEKRKGKDKAKREPQLQLVEDEEEKEVPEEERQKQEFNASLFKQHDILGTFYNRRTGEQDETFRIIDLRGASGNDNKAKSNDKRKNVTGTNATSYDKDDLIHIATHLGIPKNNLLGNPDKKQLASMIREFLTQQNRILR